MSTDPAGCGPATVGAVALAWVAGAEPADDLVASTPAGMPPAALARALRDEAIAAWGTQPVRAVRCAELAAALARAVRDEEIRALARWAEGLGALTQGRLAEALAALQDAGRGLEALGHSHEAARTLTPCVIALSMLGRHDEAQTCAEAALAAFVAAGDIQSAGKVELNLGTMLSRRDRHAQAERHFRRAAVRAARAGDLELSIRADIALANALTWQDAFDEALRVNERARVRAISHGHEVLQAHALAAIGRIELNRGRFSEALQALARAAALLVEVGASPQQRLEAESSLADAYAAVRLWPEALSLQASTAAHAQALDLPNEAARALVEQARIRRRLGDAAQAGQDFAAARSLFEVEGNLASVAYVDLALADLRLEQDDPADARRMAADAAARLAALGMRGWHHEARLTEARASIVLGETAHAEAGLAAALAEAGDLASVRLQALVLRATLAHGRGDAGGAREAVESAWSLLEDMQSALPGDPFRVAFGGEGEALTRLELELAHDTDADAAQVLHAMERGRARALGWTLAERGTAAPPPAAATDRVTLRWLHDRRRDALADGATDRAVALDAAIARQEETLLEAHRRGLLQRGASAQAPADSTPPLRTWPARLDGDQAIVAYRRVDGRRLAAVVVTDAGVRHWWLPTDGLEALIESLRFQIDTGRAGRRLLDAHGPRLLARVRRHLQALHAQLWAPIASAVGGRTEVVLVPDEPLHAVPFGALHDGARSLVETHAFTVAPSLAIWDRLPRWTPSGRLRVLAVGAARDDLPHVRQEAEQVAHRFAEDGTALCGAAATGSALRDALARARPDLLHIASHGRFRADSPSFSSVDLADGPLTLHDIQSGLGAVRLVTLSACDTGLGRGAGGDERIGLVRGFLATGTPAVVASAWKVDDASTAGLMSDWYRRLHAGERPVHALRAVQAARAAAGEHPFHWAAFALHGRG